MTRTRRLIAGLGLAYLLLGFAGASNAIGFAESPAWFMTTPEAEIAAYLDDQQTMQLCNIWKKLSKYDGRGSDEARLEIGAALERRGESAFLCQMMGYGS